MEETGFRSLSRHDKRSISQVPSVKSQVGTSKSQVPGARSQVPGVRSRVPGVRSQVGRLISRTRASSSQTPRRNLQTQTFPLRYGGGYTTAKTLGQDVRSCTYCTGFCSLSNLINAASRYKRHCTAAGIIWAASARSIGLTMPD